MEVLALELAFNKYRHEYRHEDGQGMGVGKERVEVSCDHHRRGRSRQMMNDGGKFADI